MNRARWWMRRRWFPRTFAEYMATPAKIGQRDMMLAMCDVIERGPLAMLRDFADCTCTPTIGGIPCTSPHCVRLDLPIRHWAGRGYVIGDLTWRQAAGRGYACDDIGLGRVPVDGAVKRG